MNQIEKQIFSTECPNKCFLSGTILQWIVLFHSSNFFQWSCMDVRGTVKLSSEELMLLNCGVGEDFFFSIYFYQLEANYFTILQWFLSYIDMNQPWIYMYSPSQSPLPPPSLPDSSGSSQCTRPEHLSHASSLGW